jgi:hypothetical protein
MNNQTISMMRIAAVYGALITAGFTQAQAQQALQSTTTTTSSTTSAGTVSEFTPGAITVTSGPSALPVSYSYTKTTTYVDENGNPVSTEMVKSGMPVTVYYTQNGDQMVASKVVVRHVIPTDGSTIIKKTTTTSTTTTPTP